MNNYLNQLNLTPQERRIVVIVFLVVVVVLNLLFVWPHFGEWSSINKQLETMRGTIANDNRMIALDTNPTNGFKVQVNKLSREGGGVMEHPVDPSIQLGNTIRAQQQKTGVTVSSFGTANVKTNEFFEEISTAIEVQSLEPQLVNFLYNMGQDPAMIRVARLDLQPDDRNTRYHLKGSITLTANYTKRPPTTVNTSTNAKPVAVAKPAAPAVRKTAPTPVVPPAVATPPAAAQNAKHLPPNGAQPSLNRPQGQGGKPNMPNRPIPFPKRGAGQPAQPGQSGAVPD